MTDRMGYISLLSLVALAGCAWFAVSVAKFQHGESCQSDFLTFYAAGRLAFTGKLYDHDAARQVYREAGCPHFPLTIIRPAFYSVFMKPFSLLPYSWAYRLWLAVCAIAVLAFARLWPGDKWRALAICAWSFPLMANFAYGQDGPLMLLVTGAVIRFLGKAENKSAAILALGAAKIHIFAPAGLWLLAGRRWSYARSLLAGGALLFVVSVAAGGPAWLTAWMKAATSPAAAGAPETTMGIGNLITLIAPDWLGWIASGALLGVSLVVLRRSAPALGLALVPVIGILLTSHSFNYDVALCIPLLLIILESDYPFVLQSLAFAACIPVIHLIPAPHPLRFNAQWLIPSLVIGTMIVELRRKPAVEDPGQSKQLPLSEANT
jgi:glycosyl transferase family 87